MKLDSFANKLAKKTFQSAKFQQSWMVHMQAFGPILADAFVEDYAARIHLAAALNNISRKEFSQGLEKLQKIQDSCQTDADRAAWLFFAGLLCDMAGQQEQAMDLYCQCNEFGHRFYMPYLKVAKAAHMENEYDLAEQAYRDAINCFHGTGLDDSAKTILASAHLNLSTCLMMMHRIEEAEAALATARQFTPENPAFSATEAVIAALRKDEAEAKRHLAILEGYYPAALAQTGEDVAKILAGKHSHFIPVPLVEGEAEAFWDWFTANEKTMLEKLEQRDAGPIFDELNSRLSRCFPEEVNRPRFRVAMKDGSYRIELLDCYNVSLQLGYTSLLQARPEGSSAFDFIMEH